MILRKFSPNRLREARDERTRSVLAAAAGVSDETIRRWESGAGEPGASDLAAIANVTKKPLDFFFEPVPEEAA
jgi:transcriptional regulator with XRE-family HTH domain